MLTHERSVSVSEEIEWPEDEWAPPDDAQDLISKLLIHNPLNRLGVAGAQQVTTTALLPWCSRVRVEHKHS